MRSCRIFFLRFGWPAALVVAVLAGLASAGCEKSGDKDYDHDPAAGKGGLIVDNQSTDDIIVYVDGEYVLRVNDWSDEATDLPPGVHRIVLDQRHGDRMYGGDVDILDGRLTIVVVQIDRNDDSDYELDVSID